MVYDLYLDPTNTRITEIRIALKTLNRPTEGGAETAVIFDMSYRFDREGALERFDVPADAAKFLK